jgi:hypothetical protein
MKKISPESMAAELAAIEGLSLCAVILYGSAAAGDRAGTRSNANLLIVLEQLGRDELDMLAPRVRQWIRAGNPSPQIFTRARLTRSADVFPIELQDIKETGRILHGEDVLASVRIHPEHLRIEVEHELKGKFAALQSEYLRLGAHDRALRGLMAESLSTFLVLARALLRFFDPSVPPRKFAALTALRKHIALDSEAFEAVQAVKEGRAKPRGEALRTLFDRYLAAIDHLTVTADTRLDPGGGVTLPASDENNTRKDT